MATPLRILHVLTHAKVARGGAIQAMLLASAQNRAGHKVQVLHDALPDAPIHPSFNPWIEEGIPIKTLVLRGIRTPLRIKEVIGETRPHIIHAHRELAVSQVWAASFISKPFALVAQRGTTHPLQNAWQTMAHRSRRTHRIIAVANAVKEALIGYGVTGEKIEVVYGSFDPHKFDPHRADRKKLRDELQLDDSQKLVVQVGALHPKKSPRTFIQMAARLTKDRPEVLFAIVGWGKRADQSQREIDRLGVGDRVKLLGFRTDIPEVYAAADVAVNTSSRHEGLTGAIREALAMEKAVVATKTDGNPELIIDNETGLLNEIDDVDGLAQSVGTLLDHPDRAAALGEAGRRKVLELMAPEVRLMRTEEVYEKALKDAGVSASSSA